ncbi:transporter associated domain-containing protein [Ancylobacter sp. SL191]|jgi:CBS domain containing-hemolysin-like protein|uniref:transporter associated domain-containing protein n=1 Tax=Ancylobacter sp. SL191 TaxID=2995166 RepID=UPI00227199EE|nr:hemolysin family protein [Ancylobacter sp. SL191]WAC28238.1 hemolysin family protein [Ancylobacter sp. SL191]
MSDPVSSAASSTGSEGSSSGPSTGSSTGSSTGASQSRGAPATGSGDLRPADSRGGLFDRLRQLIGGRRFSGSLRTDLAEALAANIDTAADLTPTERSMLKSVLGLRELRIGDLMVPRADIVAVQKDISLGELLTVFANAGHSRLVVYDDTLDDPVGMVHIRDLVAHLTQRAMTPRREAATKAPGGEREPAAPTSKTVPSFNLKAIDLTTSLSAAKLIRRLLFVPPSMPSIELLASMQASRIHLALVIDEYGGTDGIVSMEDLVEVIVGDIEDEHDDDDGPLIARQADGSFIADARAGLEEVAELVDPAFALGEEAEEVDTLGGLLVTLAGRVPVRGEIVPGPGGFEIEVLDADPRRVKRLRLSPSGTGTNRNAAARAERDERASAGSLPPPAEQGAARGGASRQDPDAAA